jgi:ATP-dependent exoDNAse (exonuclease V) alpha subunit
MKTPVSLSHEFTSILNQMEYTQDHLFITGRAGTGKSTLLQIFRTTTKKRVVVLAPTGIAALNVRGQTIHSFFGFPPKLLNRNEIEKRKNNRVFVNLDMVIIDEISMVRADIIDNMDYALQINRKVAEPFGGVQMVFFGDLFQLPPVVSTVFEKQYFSSVYDTPYFFSAKVMSSITLRMIELVHVYRQDERNFIRLLDSIRLNSLDYDDFLYLNERFVSVPEDDDFYITLCSRNDIAHRINEHELKSISSPIFQYHATVSGEFNPQLYPTELNLVLKVGAQVMFVKNDLQKQYVNGTIGIVDSLSDERITVRINETDHDEKILEIERQEWEVLRYENDASNPSRIATKIVGTFKQYPLRLAWAITIHKSQGKTFEKVIIDMGNGAFESGQTYVALSRCRTLGGIILRQPLRGRDIIVDERITEYYNTIRFF